MMGWVDFWTLTIVSMRYKEGGSYKYKYKYKYMCDDDG
jgi:hypothetical protein